MWVGGVIGAGDLAAKPYHVAVMRPKKLQLLFIPTRPWRTT
jgi:hypothetical protein